MKKLIISSLVCVIFICALAVPQCFCLNEIVFVCDNKEFTYSVDKNIKKSRNFYEEFELNKYNRFGTTAQKKELLIRMLQLGFDKDVIIEYLYPNISKTIEKIERTINVKERDATLSTNSNTKDVFLIAPHVVGKMVNRWQIYEDLVQRILNDQELCVNVKTNKIIPHVVTEDYQKYTHLRADFSTSIASSSADRKHNVKNALNSLNFVEVLPSETFSFNECVGRRTTENGYRQAKIIVGDEFIDGLGGGVCQVSTTLYNTALLSGLEIVEANKHSKQIAYVKHGFDAMVNFGSSDLKFKNNTNQKITIVTNYTSNSIRIRIFGEDMGDTSYALKNEILNVVEPQEIIKFDEQCEYTDKVIYEDESFYLKRASKGMDVKSYRECYKNGELIKKELLRTDKFKVQDAIKIYGSKKRPQQDACVA